MDNKALAEKLWQAISDQADDDGGVVHKSKATEAIERALAKLVPGNMPSYGYPAYVVACGNQIFSITPGTAREIDQMHTHAPSETS